MLRWKSAFLWKKIFKIYLNGGVLKQIESEKDVFMSENELLQLGYEKFGDFSEHTMFEKWHETSKIKAIKFKIYFFNGKPECSGFAFWNYRLNSTLKLAKPHVKKIEVFFDKDFDCGALIVNEFCVLRFDFDGGKYPKITTLETDKHINERCQSSKIATHYVRIQYLEVKNPKVFPNSTNVELIFRFIASERFGFIH